MKQKPRSDKAPIELLEEAVHLLRRSPTTILVIYYLGALPFVLGLLFFWADMSRSPVAPRILVGGSLSLALLFVWMKTFQAIFARQLRALASNRQVPSLTLRRCLRIFVTQSVLQPAGLFLLPLALLVFLPFGWTCAFFQNITALDDGQEPGLGSLLNKARQQATRSARQNHLALLSLLGFAFFVFLNWCTIGFALPGLLKTLFGFESLFTRSSSSLLNTTFFAMNLSLTYLCVDPLLKAVYVLRCFYGESQESGEDLKAGIREFVLSVEGALAPSQPSRGNQKPGPSSVSIILFVAVILLLTNTRTAAQAQTDSDSQPLAASSAATPQELDREINQVLRQRKFTWRMPRQKVTETDMESGLMARVRTWLRDQRDAFFEWLRKLFERRARASHTPTGGSDWVFFLNLLLYTLVALTMGALLWLLYRLLKTPRPTALAIAIAAPLQPAPDLADESLGADRLPEDGWLKIGRELLARGDLRLALRAFYLASLAHLAARNLVTLAKFKSNLDYERELHRRGHALPELPPLFSENVSVFERVWYGMHEVTEELVNHFIIRVERLCGRQEIGMNKPQ